jgi:di/tricarboxylate transporter
MPPPQQTAVASVVLSSAVVLIAAILALRQYLERRGRGPDLSEADARHFARQDVRRALGLGVMLLLAVGLVVGSRLEPRIAGRTNPLFLQVWLGVFFLIFVLLVLAMLDWLATRVYARRHRKAIFEERIEVLRDEFRRRADRGEGNGQPGLGE